MSSSKTILDEITDQLAGIDLTNASIRAPKKCSHYTHVGLVDDHTRRLMILCDQQSSALAGIRDSASADIEALTAKIQKDLPGSESESDLESLVDGYEAEVAGIRTRFDQETRSPRLQLEVLKNLLFAEVERQYPEVIGKQRVIFNEDCSVGYIDHTDAIKQATESLRMGGFELVAEVIGLGHLFGRGGGFAPHAGH